MKTGKKVLAVLVIALMLVGTLAACGKTASNDTLVVGYDAFSQKFSPFFATTSYDVDVAGMTQVSLLNTDREANIVLQGINGETRSYNGTPYTYTGIADCVITQNKDDNGNVTSVVYDFTLRDDVVFSDGEKLTADDVIFSMYVLCDPTYDGSSTLYSTPILGVDEYRTGMEPLISLINAAGRDNTDFTYWTQEEQDAFWAGVDAAGAKMVQEIKDYLVALGYATEEDTLDNVLKWWGFSVPADATNESAFAIILGEYGGDAVTCFSVENAGNGLDTLMDNYGDYTKGIQTGESAPNIAGIVKTGDYSLSVIMTKFEATSVLQLAVSVAPLHYYGDAALYDYDNNQFGFVKGDLSSVRAKTTQPMGAGPYKFVNFENGVVSFEANENYYKGAPKIPYIKFQEITVNADKVAGIISETVDISEPSLTKAIIEAIKEGNSNGELTGDTITYQALDNNGYGYIGMDSTRINVGGDNGSEASKNLRKGLATILAVYRDTVVNSYYGERATVIQYPITNTSWAAPRPNDEGYEIAFSTDVDGNPIYTADMTDEEKYEAAKKAAYGFFLAAGFVDADGDGKFEEAPAGARLTYEATVPGGGTGDHPAYGIFEAAKTALAEFGITLEINDPADTNELWDGLDADTIDMWAAAWGSSSDPDMYQVYHSSNAGGNGSNHYSVTDAQLDELIIIARESDNNTYRKSVYKECFEILMDWACEVPTYQRQNCTIFSTKRVNVDTLPKDMTPYWGWAAEIETLELNK